MRGSTSTYVEVEDQCAFQYSMYCSVIAPEEGQGQDDLKDKIIIARQRH